MCRHCFGRVLACVLPGCYPAVAILLPPFHHDDSYNHQWQKLPDRRRQNNGKVWLLLQGPGLRIPPKEELGRNAIVDDEELVELQLPQIIGLPGNCLTATTFRSSKSHPELMLPGCCPTVPASHCFACHRGRRQLVIHQKVGKSVDSVVCGGDKYTCSVRTG